MAWPTLIFPIRYGGRSSAKRWCGLDPAEVNSRKRRKKEDRLASRVDTLESDSVTALDVAPEGPEPLVAACDPAVVETILNTRAPSSEALYANRVSSHESSECLRWNPKGMG
ncbi:unnamed protein product [Merluccius merluccius]